MPRTNRVVSETCYYHVVVRGVARQTIFLDDEDKLRLLEILAVCKDISGFVLHGYCLMSNHFHLLLEQRAESLAQTMKRIETRYAMWFNRKYGRSGHLFQDRFSSEPVQADAYFLAALRYIHQNPVKAGIVSKPKDYRWSSMTDYLSASDGVLDTLTDTVMALDQLANDFLSFMDTDEGLSYLDVEEMPRYLSDGDATKALKEALGIEPMRTCTLDCCCQPKSAPQY